MDFNNIEATVNIDSDAPEFHGDKKGKKGGGGITVAPDNLRSKDVMETVLGLCEGPIQGFVNGLQSFFINSTALQNADGSYNYSDVQVELYTGEPVQGPIVPILGGFSRTRSVGVDLKPNVSVTRTTVGGTTVDYLDIRLVVKALYESQKPERADVQVVIRVEWKWSETASWFSQDLPITGKTTSSPFVKEFRTPVNNHPGVTDAERKKRIDIRVTQLTTPQGTETISVNWESFQEIMATPPQSYNNTAVLHFFAPASGQLASTPEFSEEIFGLKVRVPDNYDPIKKTYSGIWSGNFKVAWTDNLAWCLYDLVMNDRYGMAAYVRFPGQTTVGINLNKWDVYAWGKFCDEFVPKMSVDIDGNTTELSETEPRFTFNGVLAEARPVFDQIRYMAGVGHAIFYDDLDGSLRLRFPDQIAPAAIFCNENVADGNFEYGFTDVTSRFNDYTVSFINKDLQWLEERRRVADQTAIASYGRIPQDFIAVGCINESEAVRRAYYQLQISLRQVMTCTFKTNRSACHVRPYDIIEIADADLNLHKSARVFKLSEDGKTLMLSDPVDLDPAFGHYIRQQLPGGVGPKIKILNPAYMQKVLQLESPLSSLNELKFVVNIYTTQNSAGLVTYNGNSLSLGRADVTHSAWGAFMNTYAVWVRESNGGLLAREGQQVTFYYSFTTRQNGVYKVRTAADNAGTFKLDGTSYPITAGYNATGELLINIPAGNHSIEFSCVNQTVSPVWITNPVGVACSIIGPGSDTNEVFNTRQTSAASQPSVTERFRVITVEETDSNPDQVQVMVYADWSDVFFKPGSAPPQDWGTVVPVDPPEPPPPVACPGFETVFDGSQRNINMTGLPAGQYRVFSRPVGGQWEERAVTGTTILAHPEGNYEFKVLPVNSQGVMADFNSAPVCPFSPSGCPPVSSCSGGSAYTNRVASNQNGSGNDLIMSWDLPCKPGDTFFDHYEVTICTPWKKVDEPSSVRDDNPNSQSTANIGSAGSGDDSPGQDCKSWNVGNANGTIIVDCEAYSQRDRFEIRGAAGQILAATSAQTGFSTLQAHFDYAANGNNPNISVCVIPDPADIANQRPGQKWDYSVKFTPDGAATQAFSTIAGSGTTTQDLLGCSGFVAAPTLMPVSHESWNTFTNNAGVWLAEGGGPKYVVNMPVNLRYRFNIPTTGTYTVTYAADDNGSYQIDSGAVVDASGGFAPTDAPHTQTVTLSSGEHFINCSATNSDWDGGQGAWTSNPACIAIEIRDQAGNLRWSTRETNNLVSIPNPTQTTHTKNLLRVSHPPAWSGFMNDHAVWITADGQQPYQLLDTSVQIGYQFTAPTSGNYLVRHAADDFGKWRIDNGTTYDCGPFSNYSETTVYLSAGVHTMTCCVVNKSEPGYSWDSNPGGIAIAIYAPGAGMSGTSSDSGRIFSTRDKNNQKKFEKRKGNEPDGGGTCRTLRTENIPDKEYFVYTADMQRADGGPYPEYTFTVKTVDKCGQKTDGVSTTQKSEDEQCCGKSTTPDYTSDGQYHSPNSDPNKALQSMYDRQTNNDTSLSETNDRMDDLEQQQQDQQQQQQQQNQVMQQQTNNVNSSVQEMLKACREFDRPILKAHGEIVSVKDVSGNITLDVTQAGAFVLHLTGSVNIGFSGGCPSNSPPPWDSVSQQSGGTGIDIRRYHFNNKKGTVTVNYNMYTIQDKLEVIYNDQVVATTGGFVGSTGALTWTFSGGPNDYFEVKVTGSDNVNTAWTYSMSFVASEEAEEYGRPIKIITIQPAAANATVSFVDVKWRKGRAVSPTFQAYAVDMWVLFKYPDVGWLAASAGTDFK